MGATCRAQGKTLTHTPCHHGRAFWKLLGPLTSPPHTTMVGLSGSFWGPLGAAPPLRAAPLGHAPLMGFVLAPCPMTGAFKPLQWPLGSLTRGTVGLLPPQHRQHHRGMANHWGERWLSAAMPTWVALGPTLPRCKQGPSTMVHTGAHRLEPQKALRIP